MSKGKDGTTVTLSFGGVEFCLAPSVMDDTSATLSVSTICDGEVVIDLDNFTGTLHVNKRKAVATGDIASGTAPATDIGHDNLVEGCMSVGTSSPKDKPNAVVAAAASTVPAAVEDTPSPQAKPCAEENPAQNPRQRKGQQKLNFFGRKKCMKSEKQGEKHANEEVASPASSKRSPVEAESGYAKRKKVCDKSELKESSDAFIEEPKYDPDSKNQNSFSIASLGQTLLSSEENDYSGDGHNNLMLSSPTDEKLKPIVKKGTVSILSNKLAHGASSPCPRWGQTMTMIDHKRFIVYGGQTIDRDTPKSLSDLFVYDLVDHKWTKPINCEGIARTWHTANFLPERQLLLCFGGEIPNGKTGKLITTDQITVLDCEIMLWYPPTVSGQVPSGRSGHASCVLPTNELVVFGGVKNGRFLNSASILDTNRWRWTTLKAFGDAPPPRSYHSATAIGNNGPTKVRTGYRIVIFGGNNGSKCFNGVHVLESAGEGKKWVWTNPKCKGELPSPRTGHNATLLNDSSTILIYGGWDPNNESGDKIFGDSFLLNTKTWTWKRGPKPRYEKSRNKASNGGAERVGHSAVLAPGTDGVQVLVFGGRLPEGKLAGDFQSLTAPL